jgi:hypothetical protein
VTREITARYRTSQTGSLLNANFTSSVFTSMITASASLLFYPAMPRPDRPAIIAALRQRALGKNCRAARPPR